MMRLVCLAVMIVCTTTMTHAQSIRLEAENTEPAGGYYATTRPSYSGTGYISGIDDQSDKIIFHVAVPQSGVYHVAIRYAAPSYKGYELSINGLNTQGGFRPTPQGEFAMHDHGLAELEAGINTITFGRGWGYYDIDYVELTPAQTPPAPVKPPATLIDPAAAPEAVRLMQFLVDHYGQSTLSGVYSVEDAQYVKEVTGETPLVIGSDLIEYSPSRQERGSKTENLSERLIDLARQGHIITLAWHWNAPSGLIDDPEHVTEAGKKVNAIWWRGFYTEATTFDVEKALADTNSEDYKLLLRDIDVIAKELKKFADAGVPVLWRPLHEAEGQWFWWGARGPEPLKALWRLMHDRLTNEHGMHNLIWVYTIHQDMDWYPGDAYVDILGVDAYPPDPRDPLTGSWQLLQDQFAGKKLLTLSEVGKVPDVARMQRLGVWWSYFNSWTGDIGPRGIDKERLREIYTDPGVMNLEDRPAGP